MKELNEQMARLDGYVIGEVRQNGARFPMTKNGEGANTHPDYTEDLNAVHKVLKGLDDTQMSEVWYWLTQIVGSQWENIRATPLQMCEAILRAVGKWTKEMEGE